MRLSDVKGERVFDVVADIITPLIDIATSAEVKELLHPMPCPDGMDPREFMLGRIRQTAPSVLRNHKHDVVSVLAPIAGVTPEEYMEDMTFPSLLADVTELLQDEVFTDFLASLNNGTE